MTRKHLAASLFVALALVAGAGPAPARAAEATQPLFSGLGKHTRKVTTASRDAQRYFDQGLNFLFAFNHDEAIRSFRQAAVLDPGCAMAHWGIALANGPHINNPAVDEAHARAAWAALGQAQAALAGAAPVERALVGALAARYADPQPADRKPLDQAYADAMRGVWRDYPGDADVGALFAEALMDLRPWDLWTPEGQPQPGTEEVLATLEAVLARSPRHPLANHLYIHAVEASPYPEKADAAADRLRDLQPGLGHMVHMPSHIDVRRGRWQQAAAANRKAIEADRRYRERVPEQGFYRIYMAHNHHMLAYSYMMEGQGERAIAAIGELVAGIPPDFARESAAFVDGYMAMPLEVLMRFGRWEEILAAPEPAEYHPIARALRHGARGVAYAAQGKTDEARAEQQLFAAARERVSAEAFFGNNPAAAILDVAEHLLAGEILFREGERDGGLAELRLAVAAEDRLRYDEPPDWIQPVRHALGAALLEAGQAAEAEAVYREDLRRLPDNGWSLFGLARSLRMQGREGEAARAEADFKQAWKRADVKLRSSCFCQPGV